MLKKPAKAEAKRIERIAKEMPKMKKRIFTAIKKANPSKSKLKMTPGSLTKPQEAISIHISVIKVLFRIRVAMRGKEIIPVPKRT